MFGRRRKDYRRRPNILFVTFRLTLSLLIFAVLLSGIYSAYKQFSGVDPKNLSPKAVISNFGSVDKLFGMVSGLLSMDIKQKVQQSTGKVAGESTQNVIPADSQPQTEKPKSKSAAAFKFALVADSHSENDLLGKALRQAKDQKVAFVIGLGDYTEVGTVTELTNAKKELDSAGIRYFVTPGDHDLWDSRNRGLGATTDFNQVFGPTNQAFSYGNARFMILDNSDNYLGLGQAQTDWLKTELDKSKNNPETNAVFALMHEPLYHPSSTRMMGKVTPELKNEAGKVIKILKEAGVKEAFFGDIHYFTQYSEPTTGLSMTTIGAVASQRNTEDPRFGIVTVNEDGSFKVEDIEIK